MINLKLNKNLFVPKFYPLLFDYSSPIEAYMGSAGSAKSYFITQKLIVRACSEQIKILVCRRWGTTIRNSCFSLFKNILRKWKLTPYVNIRETDFHIQFPNGSEIIFLGLDEETKLLSLDNVGCIFIEEVFEITRDVFEQLNLRMRADVKNSQLLMAWNPINKNHWLYQLCEVEKPPNLKYIHSTFRDNPFLPERNRQYILSLYESNPAKARVFGDGKWGVNPEGLVIKNWSIIDDPNFNIMDVAKTLENRNGIDLGWIDKSAIIRSLYDKKNKTIYVFDEFYKSGCQLTDLVKAMQSMGLKKSKVYVDSAEPRSIQFFRNNGINAVAAQKGPDSVKAGLMFLQDHKILVTPNCTSMINELENFSYIKSKQTGEYTEDTTHEFSHAIDALRYGYSDIYTNNKVKIMSKGSLGL